MTQNIPTIEKQGLAVGTPFQVVSEPSTIWRTNYNYYLAQKLKGESMRPLMGRFVDNNEKGQFQIFENGDWVNVNFWDYSEPVIDASGNIEMNRVGKPKSRPFFRKFHEYQLKFESPISVEYWDRELSQKVTTSEQDLKFRFSTSISEKIQDQLNDERNKPDSFFELVYDGSKVPAEQYKVKYVRG